ncbi:MAG TPA: hydantoinase B/oxoprolinase family protein [Ktedonobacterales bacterium]|nr:hydantoinase B/oxoprolinase family protein [Ktedonobacterales bacterium]
MVSDPLRLQILWTNCRSIVNEHARALQRSAFSPVVRDAGDLAAALFDRRGRMVAQSVTGTPGHINSLAAAADHFLRVFPIDSLEPGDVLISNDPWLTAGQLLDITIITPVFRHGRAIALFGSTIHHVDVGGYGVGSGALDVFEEGLRIPVMKFMQAGALNASLAQLLRANSRAPEQVFGDLNAQVGANEVAARRILALCEKYALDDIETLADEIISTSEHAMREAIRQLPEGSYVGVSHFDVPGGEEILLRTTLTANRGTGELVIDFAGSSGQSRHGINVVLNYTRAYATFAVRSALNPELPNNAGSLAPIRVDAPEGCIVNAQPPAPCSARHVVGMHVPMPIMKAMAQMCPERVIAEGSGAVWTAQIQGYDHAGQAFISSMFNYSGGMGARATREGLSATCYPTGVAAVPVEILEASSPIRFLRRELRPESGGGGRQSGGCGQTVAFVVDTNQPWILNAVTSRVSHPAEGLLGGQPGATGSFLVNGKPVSSATKLRMQPDDIVTMITPGGGGYGADSDGNNNSGHAE